MTDTGLLSVMPWTFVAALVLTLLAVGVYFGSPATLAAAQMAQSTPTKAVAL